MKALNLFYSEPDPDRWFKYDRFPRKIIRRLVRGKQRPGGVMTVAINLMEGLDRLKIPYRFNDFRYIKNHPGEVACIIGKPHLLFERDWENPVLYGAGVFSHPIECPDLFEKYHHVKHLLVPGDWMLKMFEPYYGKRVSVWPTGIDTEKWKPTEDVKKYDFLIYDKIRWFNNYQDYHISLLKPIISSLENKGLLYHCIHYGHYHPQELEKKLSESKAVIFLCEHESQGIAYQQILSSGIPILAWYRGGFRQDHYYYPHKVKFGPVSLLPV